MRFALSLLPLLLVACSPATPPAESPAHGHAPRVGDREPTVRPAIAAEQAVADYEIALAAAAEKAPVRSEVERDGQTIALYSWEDPRLIVTEGCVEGGKPASCDALNALRRIASIEVTVGNGTPASYYCKPSGGEPVAVKSKDGESELCQYADGSALASWSLVYVPQFGKEHRGH